MNPQRNRPAALAGLAALLVHLPAAAGEPAAIPPAAAAPDVSAWERFNDWGVGPLSFGLHLHGLGGFSSADEVAGLASGGHDPQREAFSAQALEPDVSLRTDYLEGFANAIFFQDAAGDWDGEWEEAFLKLVKLPGGFSLKGGQFMPHFGLQNDKHLHSWDFVDAETVLGRFLGEHGLLLRGGQLDWELPLGADPVFVSVLSLAYGEARPHEHDHGHESHGGAHAHAGESLFEGEEGVLADNIWSARLAGRYRSSDFHTFTGGLSWAGGDNGFGRDSQVAGIDCEYLWRENGLEPAGRAFRWRNELLWRRVGATAAADHDDHDDHGHDDHGHDDHGHDDHDAGHADEVLRGTFEELGFYSTAVYTWNQHFDTGLRAGWVEGIEALGLDERWRVSPVATWWLDSNRRAALRLQYNYDHTDAGDEHSLWLQVRLSLGRGDEVR
jgi:hypothetical protein